MKILSIDVGIKNLAYCLFYVKQDKTLEIDSWDVLNVGENTVAPTCDGIQKSKKPCTHLSKYFFNNTYYCKTHAKSSSYIIPSAQYKESKIVKQKIGEVKQFCSSHMLDVSQCKVKKDFIEVVKKFFATRVMQPVVSNKASELDLVTIGKKMASSFDDIFSKHKIDLVLIENQISPIANRMKTIQGMISQYFIMRDVEKIEFVSSSNKLKAYLGGSKKLSYSDRKKKGIEVIHTIANSNVFLSSWIDFFNKHKKKDDLADSFLQGLWYMTDKGLISPIS